MNRIENYYDLYRNDLFNPKNWDWYIKPENILGGIYVYVVDGAKNLITRFACSSYDSAMRLCRMFGVHCVMVKL